MAETGIFAGCMIDLVGSKSEGSMSIGSESESESETSSIRGFGGIIDSGKGIDFNGEQSFKIVRLMKPKVTMAGWLADFGI